MSVLNIENLSFSYPSHSVISDLNCRLEKGRLVALLGKNGCGKTTLFRCILGLLRPQKGSIRIKEKSLLDYSVKELGNAIAYIPQEHYPIFNYRVFEVMMLGFASKLSVFSTPKDEDYKKALDVLRDLNVEYLMEKRYRELSGGERQIVLIARAVLQGASLMIMDEPTANLDYGNQIRIMKYIRNLANNGYTVLLSTHNPEYALLYCDETLVMHEKKIVAQGESREVLTQDLLKEIYDTDLILTNIMIDQRSYDIVLPG